MVHFYFPLLLIKKPTFTDKMRIQKINIQNEMSKKKSKKDIIICTITTNKVLAQKEEEMTITKNKILGNTNTSLGLTSALIQQVHAVTNNK